MNAFQCCIGLILFITSFSASAQVPAIIEAKNGLVNIEKVEILNSEYRETNISITPNARYLFFMSGRGGEVWSTSNYTTFNGKPEFDGDILMSEKKNGQWGIPTAIGANINTYSGEDEPVISQDG
ncbi:MAG: PD40 domain-containing protein, partial [Flavobacteriales bacterium]|nr:PD40 domain-containing protein [Flavobacteriales bacterium]